MPTNEFEFTFPKSRGPNFLPNFKEMQFLIAIFDTFQDHSSQLGLKTQ